MLVLALALLTSATVAVLVYIVLAYYSASVLVLPYISYSSNKIASATQILGELRMTRLYLTHLQDGR